MTKEVKITAYAPAKSGVSQLGKQWNLQDLVVSWEEENAFHDIFKQNCLASVSGELDQAKLDAAVKNGDTLTARIYFDARVYDGRIFASNRVYLPQDFYVKNKRWQE